MARKIYRTLNGIVSYSTGLVLDKKTGRKAYAYFDGGVTHPKFIPSTYETDDEEIQKALEASASFGKKFELAATLDLKKGRPAPAPKAPKTDGGDEGDGLKAFPNTSIQTAIGTLIKQGWAGNADELVDNESVEAAANSIGITFPKLKE